MVENSRRPTRLLAHTRTEGNFISSETIIQSFDKAISGKKKNIKKKDDMKEETKTKKKYRPKIKSKSMKHKENQVSKKEENSLTAVFVREVKKRPERSPSPDESIHNNDYLFKDPIERNIERVIAEQNEETPLLSSDEA